MSQCLTKTILCFHDYKCWHHLKHHNSHLYLLTLKPTQIRTFNVDVIWLCEVEMPSIHPLSVTALSLLCSCGGFCWSQSQLSLGEGRANPAQVASSLQGPHWWQRLPCKVPTAHQEQFGVQNLAQGHFYMQLCSARSWDLHKLRSLADLLYPPNYSRPIL